MVDCLGAPDAAVIGLGTDATQRTVSICTPLVLVKPRCLSQVESPQGVNQTQISLDGGTSNSMSSLALQQWLVSLYEKYSF